MPRLVRHTLLIVLLLASQAALAQQPHVTARHGRSAAGTIGDLPFVVLRGTLEERGQAFGALCGRQTVQTVQVLAAVVQQRMPNGWDQLVAISNKAFVFPPEQERQMAAFIEGFRKALPPAERIIPAAGRELSVGDLKAFACFPDLAGTGRVPLGGCSSFSAWGALTTDGQIIAGRNADYTTFPGQFVFMVIAQEPAEEGVQKTIEVSGPGVFGASTAINEQGVVLLLHDERGLPPRLQGGWVPRVAVLRQAIEKARAASAIDDVAAVLRGAPLTMGGNIHVLAPMLPGGPLPAIMEWDGNAQSNGLTIRTASADLPSIFCTNHYVERRAASGSGSSADRFARLERATKQAAARGEKIDVKAAQALMDQVAVRGGSTTYMSVIVRPHLRELTVAVSPGPGRSATDGHWVPVRWEEVFGAK